MLVGTINQSVNKLKQIIMDLKMLFGFHMYLFFSDVNFNIRKSTRHIIIFCLSVL